MPERLRIEWTGLVPALACAVYVAAHAMAEVGVPIDIAPGDLIPALELLSKQAAVDLVYEPRHLKSFRTDGMKGTDMPQEAVRLVLQGTPLELRRTCVEPGSSVSRARCGASRYLGEIISADG